ncbi:hypothetical protein HDU81_010817, partial [Chytriomyces hyalinus]
MPKQPRKRHPSTTATATSSSAPAVAINARKGDAEIPSDLDLFFLELDALFNAHANREHIDSLHAQLVADMRDELARDSAVSDKDSDTQSDPPQNAAVSLVMNRDMATHATPTEELRLTEAVAVVDGTPIANAIQVEKL